MKKFIIGSALIGILTSQSFGIIRADKVTSSSKILSQETTRVNSKSSFNKSLSSNVQNYWSSNILPCSVSTDSGKRIGVGKNEMEYLKTFGTGSLEIYTEFEYCGDTGMHDQTVHLPSGVYTKNSIENAPIDVNIYTTGGYKHTINVGYYFCDKHSKVIHVVMDSNKLQGEVLNYSTPSKVGNNYQFINYIHIGVVSQSYIDSLNKSNSLNLSNSAMEDGSSSLSNVKSSLSSSNVSSLIKNSSISTYSSSKSNLSNPSLNSVKKSDSKLNSSENNSLNLKSSVKKSNSSSELKDSANSKFNGNIPDNDDNQQASKGYSSKNSLGKSLTKSSSSELKSVSKRVNQIENSSVGDNIKHQNDLNAQGQTESKQQNNLKTGPNSDNQKLPQTGDRPFNIIEFIFDLFK